MTKTPLDFQRAAIENDIRKFELHKCSICNYPCGFIFKNNFQDVLYDHGCDCTRLSLHRITSWEEVASLYNMQSDEKYIKKTNEFWRFSDDKDFSMEEK